MKRCKWLIFLTGRPTACFPMRQAFCALQSSSATAWIKLSCGSCQPPIDIRGRIFSPWWWPNLIKPPHDHRPSQRNVAFGWKTSDSAKESSLLQPDLRPQGLSHQDYSSWMCWVMEAPCHMNHDQNLSKTSLYPGNLNQRKGIHLVVTYDILRHLTTSYDILWHFSSTKDGQCAVADIYKSFDASSPRQLSAKSLPRRWSSRA